MGITEKMSSASNTLGGGDQLVQTSPASTDVCVCVETCPECGEAEECYEYSKEIEASGVMRRHTRMCSDCFCGEKERKCEECGCAFTPKDDDTFYVCAECWEDFKCERCEKFVGDTLGDVDGKAICEACVDEMNEAAVEGDGPCERCGCEWCEADDEMGDHELFVSHKDGKNICRDCVWKEDEEE